MKYQFMPLFWGDFLANTMHLTAQEAGAYLFLIGHAWEHDGEIAAADLQRVARIGNAHWHKVRPRLEQFFTTTTVVGSWYHERVHSELIKAAEISNKRKGAALQMHNKCRANGYASHDASTLQLPINNLANGKGRETPLTPQVVFQDKGNDYRAPPASKSDHVLAPLPVKQPPRPPIQKQSVDKKPTESSRQELDAIYAARKSHSPTDG